MKSIIYYDSKTNHTKNYAHSLSARIGCDYFFYKNMSFKKMKDFDTIIYMAPIRNNKILHIEKFLKLYKKIKNKNLFVIAVGMQPSSKERRETIIITNLLNDYHIRLYELIGGFDANKLPKIQRKIMEFGLKIAAKKDPSIKEQEDRINNFLKFPFDYNDIEGIERIMATIHRLEREVKI